jgi:CheY-like chemotaxis protein
MASGLHLCDDMMFASRVSGEARAHGLAVKMIRSPERLLEEAGRETPPCVLLDLGLSGLDLPNLIRRLGETCDPMPRMVAYGSHVDAEGLRAARAAGCDPVLPRSKFIEELPRALPNWFSQEKNIS